jgi:hypothetical protein
MYLEGAVIAGVAGLAAKPPKWAWPLLVLLWPLALPLLGFRTYKKYQPLIEQVMKDPFLKAMIGIGPPPPNPFAALLGNQGSSSLEDMLQQGPPVNPLEELLNQQAPASTEVEVEVKDVVKDDNENEGE